MTRLSTRHLVVLLAATLPSLAFAHVGGHGHDHDHGVFASFATGFTHPFTGLDHLAAMVALGVWSALTARRVWVAPLAFAFTVLIGTLLGAAGVEVPAIEPAIAASLLVLGLLVATQAQLPALVGSLIAAGFALFHGAAHGSELLVDLPLWAFTGIVAATAVLHAAGVGLGMVLRERHRWLPRVAGAGVALFGASLLIA